MKLLIIFPKIISDCEGMPALESDPALVSKYKKEGGLLEGHDSNSVTFYFKKGGDNSAYKSVNQSFDDMSLNSILGNLDGNAEFIKNQSGYADFYPEFGWFGTLDTIDKEK